MSNDTTTLTDTAPCALGYYDGHLPDERPAVIVNPAAPASSRVAWCHSEADNLLTLARVLLEDDDHGDIACVFWQRLDPLVKVLWTLMEDDSLRRAREADPHPAD